ncbi:rhomboid family intramembrane serine protease [Pontibacter sp. Tf4]|uniref:rhomboid family intramembrane serine protease n=1 Tax=Pontibacter sp. Tf4 TaxID=2761620 RepID=UPI00162661CE|nr:rhomboid family intramembrane serine protease [Pontibacter sp. Tf4]MBB6609829.1 rhomboid family intramembrane serine protease [Pontibacter sp. Tf4]
MTNFLLKLRLLFLPFICWAIGFTCIYTFLHWLLIIKAELITLHEVTIHFGLPVVFTGLFVFLFLRKRLKMLRLKTKTGDLPTLFLLIAWIALSIPVIIAQKYIITATGSLTELHNISDLSLQSKSKYYSLQNYHIDKKRYIPYSSSETSGKHNNDLIFYLHVVLPIIDSQADTSYATPVKAWLGINFSKKVSNRLSPGEKEAAYQEFMKDTWQKFVTTDLHQFKYLDRIGSSYDLDKYKQAIEQSNYRSASTEEPVILVAVHEPYAARNGSKLFWFFTTLGIISAVWLLMISIPGLNMPAVRLHQKGKKLKDNELKDLIDIFTPKEGYLITPVLLIVNVLVFACMVIAGLGFISFESYDLYNWGGNMRPAVVTDGEWWRLLTNIFLHGGLMHLLMNIVALLFVAPLLEAMLGKYKFTFLYLLSGIMASLASIMWYSATVSIGASGAIFGLYGFLLVLLITKVFHKSINKSLLISAGIFIAINLAMGLTGGIDNAAHIGGLMTGIILGFGYYISIYGQLDDEVAEEEPEEMISA